MKRSSSGKRQKGFTLLEVLVCIGIIAVVAAISFPVIKRAKEVAMLTTTKSNLHQMWLALQIYRDQWGKTDSGSHYEVGMPLSLTIPDYIPKLSPPMPRYDAWKGYLWLMTDPTSAEPKIVKSWEDYSRKCGVNVAVIADYNFNDTEPFASPFLDYRGIGIRLSGQISDLRRKGLPVELWWWWGCGKEENQND